MADLRYPLKNIEVGEDYFKIQVIEYKEPTLNLTDGGFGLSTTEDQLQNTGSIQRPIVTIILPMPANIQDSNSADWVSGNLDPLQAGFTNAASSVVLSQNPLGSIMESLRKFGVNFSEAVNTGEGQKSLAAGTAFAALKNAIGQGDLNQITSRATGMVFNQNVELLFGGVTIRPAFNFTFDMVPRSKEESDRIKSIIRTFKFNMTPRKGRTDEAGSGLFVKAPNVFKLEYMSGGKPHPFLHKFKPCALMSMGVNYNGSSHYVTYSDATPVHMQLTLYFQELTPIYQESYTDLDNKGDTSVGY